ncbi:glycosyltransferase family 2 protein [Cereibacter sphaeroides]|uniref:glycosyltransferase family 2 protein n=1 Tax=Cereibacter sphaeroides TaxID=1063 RepID=UPI001F19EAE6|nr:glycosyltransferase family 2 protein [Cereibacter sphaeroides]MCE6949620.1 glycosyltransferase family 2 protein [Cereibacter sphaeroides]
MTQLPPPTGISVVIPTMNRAAVLLDTLRDLQNQTFRNYEVIVVDQSDEPNPEAEALLPVFDVPARYFYITDFRGLPEARNFGWRQAVNDIVVYTDDDIRCGPEFLQAHFDAHLKTGAAMVAGGITEAKGDRDQPGGTGSFNWWTATPGANFHKKVEGWCISGKGCNFSVRKQALAEVGGFDQNLTVGAALYEETELGLRLHTAGFRCWFAPEAHLTHLAAPMGGCRVGPDVVRYVRGMAHNRALLIYRHLRPWHRPTALLRMFLYGLSYARATRSIAPIGAALRGMAEGRRSAML